jgi:hypothetical protein
LPFFFIRFLGHPAAAGVDIASGAIWRQTVPLFNTCFRGPALKNQQCCRATFVQSCTKRIDCQ